MSSHYYQQPGFQQPNPYDPLQNNPQAYISTRPSLDSLLPKKEDRFKPSQYKDVWALVLWVTCLLAFLGFSAYSISNLVKNGEIGSSVGSVNLNASGKSNMEVQDAIGSLVLSIIVGFVVSLLYFMAMQRFTGTLITVTLYFAIAMNFVMAAFFFVAGQPIMGAIMLVLAGIVAWCMWSWRHRIPFAKVMLKTVCSVTAKYPALIFVGVLGLIGQVVFLAVWVGGVVGLQDMIKRNLLSENAGYGLYLYLIFVFYWTSQVLGNSVHITTAGVFATYFFRGVANGNGDVDVPVSNPTVAAAKRAWTTSLGPNCYGSLLIALIQLLRFLVDQAQRESAEEGNLVSVMILCCVQCILNLFQGLLEYFNKYAFAQVAIYGKDYCSAAKDTWELTKARGIDAIINDNLIGNVLGMGALAIGLITGGVACIYVSIHPNLANEQSYYVIFGLIGLFVGITEFSVLAGVIDSGVITTFVCLAEDPQALAQTKPDLYRKIQEVYPQVILGF
ncbi:plasma-membrane choline transporter-domain-containing protein [Globomyces pollinis-pini]|nr:plasma-membrane choline transporter-domain-containing protein [Globomyces pollinis-pini]